MSSFDATGQLSPKRSKNRPLSRKGLFPKNLGVQLERIGILRYGRLEPQTDSAVVSLFTAINRPTWLKLKRGTAISRSSRCPEPPHL